MHTAWFDFHILDNDDWNFLKGLRILYIDQYYELSIQDLIKMPINEIELVIHSKSVDLATNKDLQALVEMSKTHKIQALVVDHHNGKKLNHVEHGANNGVTITTKKYDNLNKWSLDELGMVSSVIRITKLSIDCLDLNDETVEEFIELLASSKLKQASICLDRRVYEEIQFKFNIPQLEAMIERGLKIITLSTSILKVRDSLLLPVFGGGEDEPAVPTLDQYVPTMKKMKHLSLLDWDSRLYDQKDKMSLYIDLPINRLSIQDFDIFYGGNLQEAIDILRQMKLLKSLSITPCHSHKFSPQEFAMFEDLPVDNVILSSLDLSTKENIQKVRKSMLKMKITSMIDISDVNEIDAVPLYKFDWHGPGRRYQSICLRDN